MTIQRAQPELLTFAEAARGEEWAGELALALTAAANAGWAWERAGLYACRLIFTEDASPRDLTEAVRNPVRALPAAVNGAPPASVAADLAAFRARAEVVTANRRAAEPDDDGGAA